MFILEAKRPGTPPCHLVTGPSICNDALASRSNAATDAAGLLIHLKPLTQGSVNAGSYCALPDKSCTSAACVPLLLPL